MQFKPAINLKFWKLIYFVSDNYITPGELWCCLATAQLFRKVNDDLKMLGLKVSLSLMLFCFPDKMQVYIKDVKMLKNTMV